MVIYILPLFLFFAEAETTITLQPGAQQGESGVFTPYLACINAYSLVRVNLAMGEGIPFEQRSAIFHGERGVYLVEPNRATVDNVPLYTPPPGEGKPEYPLAYQEVGRTEMTYLHTYIDSVTGRTDGAGGGWGEEFRNVEGNRDTPFFAIGKESSRLSNADAIQAITREAVPSIQGMNESLARERDFRNRLYGAAKGEQWYKEDLEQAKSSLCACAKTNQAEIAAAAIQEASELSLDISACGEALVSKNEYFKFFYKLAFPEASARIHQIKSMTSANKLQFANEVKGLIPVKGRLKVCSGKASYHFNLRSGQLLSKGTDCTLQEIGSSSKVVTLKNITARAEKKTVMVSTKK